MIDDLMIRSKSFNACVVIDREKQKIICTSTGYKVKDEDVTLFLESFNRLSILRDKGITYNDVFYSCLRADNEAIFAKDLQTNNRGLIIIANEKVVTVALYNDEIYCISCITAVQKLNDYMQWKSLDTMNN
ncbi:hypothetical protein SNEBB_008764 [Seison nebaliae]|nr:hypothetical protein SNEBB_008764 [Seison nebaliae]